MMVPKVVQDAGYTAVGLGVMAAQQVQNRRRQARGQLGSALDGIKAAARPVAAQLERLPRLPGPVGSVVESGFERLNRTLR